MPINAKDKLERAWTKDKVCPACGHSQFAVPDESFALVQLEGFEPDKTYIRSDDTRFYPLVVVMCTNCGYTMLFNAGKLGVIQPTDA